ncbi:MAG: alpha/beta hydrolase [Bacteroidia bacterium]|nr:alpha/beta hydrolase [Bacteroidia bacterium]
MPEVKKIYLFSGLGADERIFHKLHLPGFTLTHIKYIMPEPRERLDQYAARLLTQITSPEPVLIGLSFGGMVAVEMAKHITPRKVILIASAKTKNEIPYYYRLAGKIRLHKILTSGILRGTNPFTNWLFDARCAEEKKLLRDIIAGTDPAFLKWAVDQVVCWENCTPTPDLVHIHGTRDKILPARFVRCDISVKNGGHFMTLNEANEMNRILTDILREEPTASSLTAPQ